MDKEEGLGGIGVMTPVVLMDWISCEERVCMVDVMLTICNALIKVQLVSSTFSSAVIYFFEFEYVFSGANTSSQSRCSVNGALLNR